MKLITLFKQIKLVFKNTGKGFYILGIEKCGTVSLEKWLKVNFNCNVVREESIYCRWFGVIKYKLQYPKYVPIIITRDPVKRIYSHYIYKRYNQKGDRREINCDLKTALVKHPEIVNASNYSKWIKKWKSTEPIILQLEVMQKLDGFPKENTTKSTMSDYDKFLIQEALV